MSITLKEFFLDHALSISRTSEVLDAVYDEVEDLLLSGKFDKAEKLIKQILSISPYTILPVYLSLLVIIHPWKNRFYDTYRIICKTIYNAAFENGGLEKINSITKNMNKEWAQDILNSQMP